MLTLARHFHVHPIIVIAVAHLSYMTLLLEVWKYGDPSSRRGAMIAKVEASTSATKVEEAILNTVSGICFSSSMHASGMEERLHIS